MVRKRLVSFNDDVSNAIDEFIRDSPSYYSKGRVSDLVNQAVIDYFNSKGSKLRIRGFTYLDEDGKTYHHTMHSTW